MQKSHQIIKERELQVLIITFTATDEIVFELSCYLPSLPSKLIHFYASDNQIKMTNALVTIESQLSQSISVRLI